METLDGEESKLGFYPSTFGKVGPRGPKGSLDSLATGKGARVDERHAASSKLLLRNLWKSRSLDVA